VSAPESLPIEQPEPVPPFIYDQLTANWPELYAAHLDELKERAEQARLDAIDPADPLIVRPGVAQ
jgi:hypothetical protein